MIIKRASRSTFRIILSNYELASLISSARWVAKGAQGKLSEEAIEYLNHVLDNYDRAMKHLDKTPPMTTDFS